MNYTKQGAYFRERTGQVESAKIPAPFAIMEYKYFCKQEYSSTDKMISQG